MGSSGGGDPANSTGDTEAVSCPRCHNPLPSVPSTKPTQAATTCPTCGHQMNAAYLIEKQSLIAWRDWVDLKLTWLDDRLARGELPLPDSPPPRPAATTRPRGSSLLLAAGAALLVLAGIAFVAFAWDLLGRFGQITVLYLLGAVLMASALPLARRLHGTATAIGIVGALVIATAATATYALGDDVVGDRPALIIAVVSLLGIVAAGIAIAPRLAAVGEVAAAVGAGLALLLLSIAPQDRTVPLAEPWSWWVCLILTIGSLILLATAKSASIRSWPALAAVGLGVAGIALGVFAAASAALLEYAAEPLVFSVVYLCWAAGVLGIYAGLRRYRLELVGLAGLLFALALAMAMAGGSTPSQRPAAALVMLGIGASLLAVATAMRRVGLPSKGGLPSIKLGGVTIPLSTLAGAAAIGAAAGFLLAPWTDWFFDTYDTETANRWLDDAWPPLRGLTAGVTFALLLVATGVIANRRTSAKAPAQSWPRAAVPLVTVTAALLTWIWAAASDPSPGRYTLPWRTWESLVDAIQRQVGAALAIVGVAIVIQAIRRQLPAATVWFGAAGLNVAVLLILGATNLRAGVTPEIYSLCLMIPTAAAGASYWWLRRPQQTSTWITLAPAAAVALTPPTLFLLGDATSRWFEGAEPSGAYQARTVALVLIGAALAVVGARHRMVGLLVPGLLAVLAVTAIQLVDLGRFLPQWVSFAVAGTVLVAAGARWEAVRAWGREGSTWARTLH